MGTARASTSTFSLGYGSEAVKWLKLDFLDMHAQICKDFRCSTAHWAKNFDDWGIM